MKHWVLTRNGTFHIADSDNKPICGSGGAILNEYKSKEIIVDNQEREWLCRKCEWHSSRVEGGRRMRKVITITCSICGKEVGSWNGHQHWEIKAKGKN